MKCKRTSDGRALDHHTLEVMRLRAIKAVQEGRLPKNVAACFGVSVRSVFRWLADHAKGGESALLAKPIPGRPSKLSQDELALLMQTIRSKSPLDCGFDVGLWTLSLIRHFIKRQFSKTLSVSSVHRIMTAHGFSPQKPLYQAWQQDPVKVRTWENETWPAIRAEAKKVGARIFFADESGLRSDYHSGTTWAPLGQTPVVTATGRRFSLNMLSAVGPQGEFRFMLHEGSVDSAVFLSFLKRLLLGADRPVFVIVDGHPMHKSAAVKRFVDAQNGQLKLFYLPPYSPHLNPDETVWAHVKRDVSEQLVQSQQEMKQLALGVLRHLQKMPALVKSFFKQPECWYILE